MLTRIDRNSIICDDIKTSTGEKYATSNAVFEAQALAETAAVNAIEAANDAKNTADTIKANAIEITNEVVSEIKQETLNAQALAETAALEAIDAKSKSVEIKNEFDIYRNNGCVYSGDIILNGSKLLLANGASVELFTGEELPSPGGSGGDSYPLPEEPIDTSNFATLDGDNEFSGNNNFTGNLTVGGEEVVTTSEVESNYYKLDGSNYVKGHIHLDNSSLKTFTLGYPWADKTGALLSLRSANYETTGQEGTFNLMAINGENTKSLMGYPDGKLTWNGKNITRIESSSKGTNNWYIKLDNGLIIQGGIVNAYDKTLTFPTAFSNTNYAFSIFLTATEYINNDFSVAAGKTTTGITSIRMGAGDGSYGYNGGWTHSWIAMGY